MADNDYTCEYVITNGPCGLPARHLHTPTRYRCVDHEADEIDQLDDWGDEPDAPPEAYAMPHEDPPIKCGTFGVDMLAAGDDK